MPLLKYNDTRIIRRIAAESGLSISSVYGILGGEAGYSGAHQARVLELARTYGLQASAKEDDGNLTVGVIIPRTPGFFWDEAIDGMKKAAGDCRERGIRVRLIFRCLSSTYQVENDGDRLLESFTESPCHGYIMYPFLHPSLWNFVSMLTPDVPLILFNDRPRRTEQTHFFVQHPNCVYVGADNLAEGRQAAQALEPYLASMKHIVALNINRANLLLTTSARIEGFTAYVREVNPQIVVETLASEIASKTAASLLAADLEHRFLSGRLDCVYVSAGYAHIAAAAIHKLCRKYGADELSIPCLGHELAPSDNPYLSDGILRGYVRQDIYRQGELAIKQIVDHLLDGVPMQDVFVRSTVFVR